MRRAHIVLLAPLVLLLSAAGGAQVSSSGKPARERPKTAAELKARIAELTESLDYQGLWAICQNLKSAAFPDEPAAAVVIELCRGRALQGLGDRERARLAYREVLRVGALSGAALDGQNALAEARYRLGELAEAEYRDYPLCLRELGIFWGSRAEAEEKLNRFHESEQAYKDAIPTGRKPWPQRASFRMASLHMAFFKEVSARTAPTFRGLQGPPPLPTARVELARDALRLMLDPDHSSWPRMLQDVARAALRRAELEADDTELVAAARALVEETSALKGPPSAPVNSPFPARKGRDRGWRSLTLDGEQVLFEEPGRPVRRDALLNVGKTLLEVVRGGIEERFAPDAAVILGRGGYRAAIPLLTQAVSGPDEELAVAAIHAVGDLGAGAEVKPLLEAYARATPPGEGPLPYETPSLAVFGVRERVLEALIRIGRRDPVAVLELLKQPQLPRREAAYVLWMVSRKELRPVYQALVWDDDDKTAAYGVLGLASVSTGEAREAARLLKSRKGEGACWGSHLESILRARRGVETK